MEPATTTIPAVRLALEQELHQMEQQIVADEQQLRMHREQAAFVRGKLALLAQLVLPSEMSGAPLGEQDA